MTNATETITLFNPWTKAPVEYTEEMLGDLDKYPLDQSISETVGHHDTNVAWLKEYAEKAGIESTSASIIGS